MKLPHLLEDILGQRSMVTVLRHLALRGEESSGRGVAAALGMNPWTCHLALRELVVQGVVTRRAIGNSHLFQLNAENLVVQHVLLPLFAVEREVTELALRELVTGLPETVVSVIAHQSLASDSTAENAGEIMVMVLVAGGGTWANVKQLMAERSAELTTRFGAGLPITVLPVDEFARRDRAGDPLVRQVRASGRVIHLRDLPGPV